MENNSKFTECKTEFSMYTQKTEELNAQMKAEIDAVDEEYRDALEAYWPKKQRNRAPD